MQNRRQFLKDSALLAAAAATAGPMIQTGTAQQQTRDVSDQLRIACIGVRGQGRSHVSGYAGKHNCIVAVICDADEAVIGPGMTSAEKAQGKAPQYVKDFRKVLDDKSIDAVSIATPNHWHALMAIMAMQAGKDVYVEKPVSHNVWEGHQIVEAARKYNKICQTGTQSRSMTGMRQAIDYVRGGKIGKVSVARGLCYKPRGSIGKVTEATTPPATLDYDLWCGPAPKKPLMRKNLHYDWHWVWDTGNGDLGNQGIHEMDKARWGLGKSEMPKSVTSLGGRFGYVDDGETANTQICVFDYGDSQLIFEVRGLDTKEYMGSKVGNIFHGSEGYVVCPNYFSGVAYNPKGDVVEKFNGSGDHFGNFIQAVRSRKKEQLNADIQEGHLSSALCHLGNISYRLGKLEATDGKTLDNKDAAETLERMTQHLKERNINLLETKVRVGPKLTIDAKTETFVGNKDADVLLRREYRKPFEVPEKV